MGFLCIDPPGGKQHFFRLASAEFPCVSMIFDAANPHSNDRIAEPGVIRRYDQVTGPREHQAGSDAGTLHRGDRRLWQIAPFLRIAEIMLRSEEHTSELQSLMRISYAVFCLKKKKTKNTKL